MTASITIQSDGASAATIRLRKGSWVDLKAVVSGNTAPATNWQWFQGQQALAGANSDKLQVVMPGDGHTAGTYSVTATIDGNSCSSGVVTVSRTGFSQALWDTLNGGIPILITALAYAGLSCLLLLPIKWWRKTADWNDVRAYTYAGLTLVAFFVLVHFLGRQSPGDNASGLKSLFRGTDMRASTSKTQYLIWTFVVGFALSYDAAFSSIGSNHHFECDAATVTGGTVTNCVTTSSWGAYLLLLGLPAGAAVVSKGLVSYKISQGTMQKEPATSTSLADLTNDDAGNPDIVDLQYLLFNLIAIAYVLVKFFGNGVLPSVPDLLLGLTSTSAATYVLNKGLQNNAPVIRSVSPGAVAPGQKVTIAGDNLYSDPAQPVLVLIGGIQVPGTVVATTRAITATAPAGMKTEDPTVKVITAAQVQTDPYPIQITGPKILGWAVPVPKKAGSPAELLVAGLPSTSSVEVLVGNVACPTTASAQPDGSTKLHFTMPPQQADSAQVAVASPGSVTAALSMPLAKT